MKHSSQRHIDGAPPINNSIDIAHALISLVLLLLAVYFKSVVLAVFGLLTLTFLLAARSDYARYSIIDFGRYPRLQNRRVFDAKATCDICKEIADGGEERTRFDEVVVGGIVIARINVTSRHYCADHASVAVSNDLTKTVSQEPARNIMNRWDS